MVRGVGPGVSLRPAGAGRFRIRQRAADPHAARVVHASERPDTGVRVGVRRRESAGACVGGLARVQDREEAADGVGDRIFLERIFHKLLLNFTWWVNRKDAEGRNVFRAVFSGSTTSACSTAARPLPTGGHIEQADGTGWMAMYCLNMLAIALELANEDQTYEDVASKFWEHFLYIADAMNNLGDDGDRHVGRRGRVLLRRAAHAGRRHMPLKIRSMVGLIPLFAVETLEPEVVDKLPGFQAADAMVHREPPGPHRQCRVHANAGRRTSVGCCRSSIATSSRRVLKFMLDENEFLSPYGIRALSRFHKDHPYVLPVNGARTSRRLRAGRIDYGPVWRKLQLAGPIWFPINYLLIESLQKFHHYLGKDYKVECPTGSGVYMTLWDVAAELSRRLTHIFLRKEDGARPVHGAGSAISN